jgi:uncharacterized caspase-like protein
LSQKELAFPIFVIPGPVAGHGIEINGNNYLIPVDAVLERDIDAFDEAIPLDRILTVIEPTSNCGSSFWTPAATIPSTRP